MEDEVAAILVKLRRLIWEAASTHGLRWGARRRRSAACDDIRLSSPRRPPPPFKKRRRSSAFLVANDWKPRVTSSPVTPLEFSPSGDEAELKPARRRKPRMKQAQILTCQLEALNCARVDLEKEAEEARIQLDALKQRNSMLKELRSKLEKEHSQEAADGGRFSGDSCTMEEDSPAKTQMPPQILLPHHWMNGHVIVHGGQQWSWMPSCGSNLPDLNVAADIDPFEDLSLHHHQHHHHNQHHQQQQQKEARKKRIEMMHSRRRIAAMR